MSRPHSGAQTPSATAMAVAAEGKGKATGDYAQFLEAEELKEKLAREEEAMIKRDIKALKKANKVSSYRDHHVSSSAAAADGSHAKDKDLYANLVGHGLGGKGKPEPAEERWKRRHASELAAATPDYAPAGRTLEERGYFPGDLMHHGHLDESKHHHHHRSGGGGGEKGRAKASPSTSRLPSANTSPVLKKERLRPPAICGPIEYSDSEQEEEERVDVEKIPRHPLQTSDSTSVIRVESEMDAASKARPHLSPEKQRRSSGWFKRKSGELSRSNSYSKASVEAAANDMSEEEDEADDDDNTASLSSSSSVSSEIMSPHQRLSASVISLKSYETDNTRDGILSLASGGANSKIARPLLELEDLELDSFLRNFGRHTREVRVAHSANFPQRRMPRWEDFRVPRGEAALAAAQGKRVTVLTHVDRGLKALEDQEGEGGPPPRGVTTEKTPAKAGKTESSSGNAGHHNGLFHRKDKSKKQGKGTSTPLDDANAMLRQQSGTSEGQWTNATTSALSSPFSERRTASSAITSPASERIDGLSARDGTKSPSEAEQPHPDDSLANSAASSVKSKATMNAPISGGSLGLTMSDKPHLTTTNSATPSTTRVSWAPHPSKDKSAGGRDSSTTDYGKSSSDDAEIGSTSVLGRIFGRSSHSSSMDKDEGVAKKQERSQRQYGSGSAKGPSALAEHRGAGLLNVHDERTEWRPSRDEQSLNEEDWEVLQKGEAVSEERIVDESQMDAGDVAEEDDDRQVDGIAWAIAYILATIERYAPEELDNTPDQTFRESRTRSHIERLYLIAPFWERLLFGIRRVYRWDDPRRTSTFAMIYFTLWYVDLLPMAFLLMIMFYVCQFRFFPPSASFLHEQVRMRMARGVDADRLAERLRRRSRLDVLELYKRFVVAYGAETQLAAGDIADFHEKVKNLILWRNPTATWRTLCLLGVAAVFVTFASPHLVWKTIFGFLGFTFFILLPLQSHYPRFRRPLSPIWWALWGAPTDAQFAIQLLRRRHLERQYAKHPPTSSSAAYAAAALFDDGIPGEELHAAAGLTKKLRSGSHRGDGSSDVPHGLREKWLKHSSAAQAVAYGALKPFRSDASGGLLGRTASSENLLDLQDVKVLEGGQIMSKPRKLGSFFCQHHGAPGHLHVTTRMLYFVALHSYATSAPSKGGGKGGRKTCKTPLNEISGLVKTKSIKLFVWNSSGLQITRRNKSSLFFSNMPHRDNAFNLLLAVGSEVWHKHN